MSFYEDSRDSIQAMRDEALIKKEIDETVIDRPDHSVLDTMTAGFIANNPISSWMVQAPLPNSIPKPDYNPANDMEGYEQHWDIIKQSRNPETTKIYKQRIDQQDRQQQIIDESGGLGIASSFAAELGNPFNLALILAPEAAMVTKGKPLASALKSMAVGATTVAASEAALHATQETRTAQQTAIAIAATSLFDGVLGSIAGQLTKSQADDLTAQIAESISPPNLSMGAAQAKVASGEKLKEVTPFFKYTGLGHIGMKMADLTPTGRTLRSESSDVRATTQRMMEVQMEVEGDELSTAAETLMKLDRAKGDQAILQVRGLQKDSGLDQQKFSSELASSMRRGDVSEIPQVQAAAQKLRGIMDNMWNKATELKIPGTRGLDGEPLTVKTAQSYLARRYDMNLVRKNPEAFKLQWKKGLIDSMHRNDQKVPDDMKLDEMVDEIYSKIANLRDGDIHAQATGASGMLKQRADVMDEFLEDFLVKDWETLFGSYVNTLSSRNRLAEAFGGGEGDFMMKSHLAGVDEKARAGISKAQQAGNLKEAAKIEEAWRKDKHDITSMRDILLGSYRGMQEIEPENRLMISGLRQARMWNAATMLGGVLIASIPDLARVILAHGGKGFMKSMTKALKNMKLGSLPKDQAGMLASVADRVSSLRLQQIMDMDDGLPLNKAESYMRWGADRVMEASGMKHWNAINKTIVGISSANKFASDILAGKNIRNLKRLGIDSDNIKAQVKKHATKESDGLYTLNTEKWDDIDAAEAVEAAMIKEADKAVLTPGGGDKPLLMSGEVAKSVFQFKSFIIAATNRLTVPLMQEQGARKWMEIQGLLAMGALGYYAKEIASGREPSDDPAIVMKEAIDRTGMAAYAMEVFNTSMKIAGVDSGNSRYRSRDWQGAIGGPTVGTVSQVVKGFGAQSSPDSRARALRKLAWLQNHFLLRRGFDEVEGEAAKAMGGTGKYAKPENRGKAISF